jgi:hypothetical protein
MSAWETGAARERERRPSRDAGSRPSQDTRPGGPARVRKIRPSRVEIYWPARDREDPAQPEKDMPAQPGKDAGPAGVAPYAGPAALYAGLGRYIPAQLALFRPRLLFTCFLIFLHIYKLAI